jgi:hypothetical protein
MASSGLKSNGRIFFLESEPVEVLDSLVYPSAQEEVYIEQGISLSQILSRMKSGAAKDSHLSFNNEFQVSPGEVAFKAYKMPQPGLLIRYSDVSSYDPNALLNEKLTGDPLVDDDVASSFLSGVVWSQYDPKFLTTPQAYITFGSRIYCTLPKNAVSEEGGLLAKEVRKLFKEFLTTEKGLIFELLTPEGLKGHKPDLQLLENALEHGVTAGVSQYKYTDIAAANFVYRKLKQESTGDLRSAIELKEQEYRILAHVAEAIGKGLIGRQYQSTEPLDRQAELLGRIWDL